MEFGITFLAGASYGLTTVMTGQPLDTVKTRMQGMPNSANQSMLQVGRNVFMREGIRGLYRGGLPLVIGGSMMRSAQFGVSGKVSDVLNTSNLPEYKLCGIFNYKIILAGIAGGLGRGLVEAPTDFLKVRRQVEQTWSIKQVLEGTGVTLGRNTFLYSSFVLYMDLSKQCCAAGYVPRWLTTKDGGNLTPFAKGAVCANLAWLTIWPADVVKTQRQSGNYGNTNALALLRKNISNGTLYRGVTPGLARSTIANGCSMVIYEFVHTTLSKMYDVKRKDMT
jgi:solute carrier family 25 carnitine/acylcarnitine transporter 20/29|tara:strand:- start:33 stop:869 length:837 start_codon:yes stop_codon:yes gene_type:complete